MVKERVIYLANPVDLKREQGYELVQKLRDNGYDSIYGGSKGHGVWINNLINLRTKTTWHSYKEALTLLKSIGLS